MSIVVDHAYGGTLVGTESCRIIPMCGKWGVFIEERRDLDLMLCFIGGKRKRHESLHSCMNRECFEEAGFREKDTDTGFVELFTYEGGGHDTVLYTCGFTTMPKYLKPGDKDGHILRLHWIDMVEVFRDPTFFRSKNGLAIYARHCIYIDHIAREFPEIIQRMSICNQNLPDWLQRIS